MLHCKSGNVQIKCSKPQSSRQCKLQQNAQQTSDDKQKTKKAEATLTQ